MNDKPEIAPLSDLLENEPTANSSLDDLATYALLKQDSIIARDKMNGEDLWLMGQALQWAKAKLPHGEWEQWWKAKGFKKTYVWQARKLHDNAKLDEVKELGLTEALRKFAVVAEKKPQAGTKATGKRTKAEITEAVPTSNEDTEKQTEQADPSEDVHEQTEAVEPSKDDDDGDPADSEAQPSDDLADHEERELKAYQESIRKLTPKTRAVAIHHSLELLRQELDGEEVDEELQQTFGQIAQLAEELKGLNYHDKQDS